MGAPQYSMTHDCAPLGVVYLPPCFSVRLAANKTVLQPRLWGTQLIFKGATTQGRGVRGARAPPASRGYPMAPDTSGGETPFTAVRPNTE